MIIKFLGLFLNKKEKELFNFLIIKLLDFFKKKNCVIQRDNNCYIFKKLHDPVYFLSNQILQYFDIKSHRNEIYRIENRLLCTMLIIQVTSQYRKNKKIRNKKSKEQNFKKAYNKSKKEEI